MIQSHIFERVISKTNLFAAWREFQKGKTNKRDVVAFNEHFEEYILELHYDLTRGTYRHGEYTRFLVHDPKLRSIAKASVRDRVLHHALCRVITPLFDKAFICDSYASRKGKGVHRAIERLQSVAWRLSRNNTSTVWALKCDIKKFFASVDHERLLSFCADQINDNRVRALCAGIINSFEENTGKGVPLGNLTSQLFANVYLDRLDQYIKRTLRIKNYLRYTDDFILLSYDRGELEHALVSISDFVTRELGLHLHPDKVFFRKWHQGIDFLGYVHFPYYRVIRTKTKKRMLRKLQKRREELDAKEIEEDDLRQTVASYLGVLSHARSRGLAKQVRRDFLPSGYSTIKPI